MSESAFERESEKQSESSESEESESASGLGGTAESPLVIWLASKVRRWRERRASPRTLRMAAGDGMTVLVRLGGSTRETKNERKPLSIDKQTISRISKRQPALLYDMITYKPSSPAPGPGLKESRGQGLLPLIPSRVGAGGRCKVVTWARHRQRALSFKGLGERSIVIVVSV